MFYCRECRIENQWPESISVSYGCCEFCGRTALCSDVPSDLLPEPKEKDETP